MENHNSHWYNPLRAIESLGSKKQKIKHMGELAEARRQHLGQFFTPDAVAAFMWQLVACLPIISIFDNSIGSARLLQFASPDKHHLFGVDTHQDTVDQVKSTIEAAGFECEISCAGMETIRPRGMDASIINPPFSVHLESVYLEPFELFTRMGKFGPNTSAISHEYAVAQALRASSVVIALLPRSSANEIAAGVGCWASDMVQLRLRALIDLPSGTFDEENANVETTIVVFGEPRSMRSSTQRFSAELGEAVPDLGLARAFEPADRKVRVAKLGSRLLDTSKPSITRPVTRDNAVKVSLDGRRIKLGFACGLTEAKVLNAILDKAVYSSEKARLPVGVRFAGQGKLDLEAYLIQSDPEEAFHGLVRLIESSGGQPNVGQQIWRTLKRKVERFKRAAMPLKHSIWSRGASNSSATVGVARRAHNIDPTMWVSPVIAKGDEVHFQRSASGNFSYTWNAVEYHLNADELEARFELKGVKQGWQIVHSGLLAAYPVEAAKLRARAIRFGIDKWLSWEYQMDDLIELTLKPSGAIAAWKQALGKSRLAVALIVLSGVKHGLIVVESRLIDEMVAQLKRIDIAEEQLNVIDNPSNLASLKQINIISYERLRMLVDGSKSKRITYAHKLRRRIGLITADEGERLANLASDQSRALFQVAARKKYVLSGTPLANYPRDIHGLLVFTGGDGTAAQPYGLRRAYMEPALLDSMQHASRGIDRVRDDFVVTEWVTWEFADTLRDGAKREIPKLANVEKFRTWLAPHIKRRLTEEPEVAMHIKLPKPEFETVELQWDKDHLAFYLKAADDFASWYRQNREAEKNNLALILARLQAVQIALNIPQKGVDGIDRYVGLTSKQRAVLAYLVDISKRGMKSLVYCENPANVDLLHKELAKVGIGSVRFHGGISIKKRVADKDANFVGGDCDHLLATKASAKAGYNLPSADFVLFLDRSWSAKTEGQAMHRPMRVERTAPVRVVYFHLPGSLDIYQDQMVAFKKDSADAGLDWATPELDDEEFLHLSNILEKFVKDLASINNLTAREMRAQLKAA